MRNPYDASRTPKHPADRRADGDEGRERDSLAPLLDMAISRVRVCAYDDGRQGRGWSANSDDAVRALRAMLSLPAIRSAHYCAYGAGLRLTCDTLEEMAELVALLDPFQNPR